MLDPQGCGSDAAHRQQTRPMAYYRSLSLLVVGLCLLAFVPGALMRSAAAAGPGPGFALPVACTLGTDCFVQQMPDLDPGPGVRDPLCGQATYDGHDGWDIRVKSMADMARGVAVIAVADGKVLRARDGMPDDLYDPKHGRSSLGGRECGNGLVIEHAGGVVTQYCHLKRGSLAVKPGQVVHQGDRLGDIGASGMAEFPHVHFAARRNGVHIDPLTGQDLRKSTSACGAKAPDGLLSKAAYDALTLPPTQIIDLGLAPAPPKLDDLLRTGRPSLSQAEAATIAWVWAINLNAGDRIHITIVKPDGTLFVDQTTGALPRRKAVYLAYAGRKRTPEPGTYTISAELIRDGTTLSRQIQSIQRFN